VVTNDGDLPSGALQLTNPNLTEFVVSNDTCSGASIPGHGSCSLDIRFLASAIGPRSANLVLSDPTSAQAFTLVMTGIGRVIAQPGQSCANGATCASGECTAGVCCDRACAGTCQVCSGTGICNDQSNREACGNGSARCFGVNQCLLPEGQACSGDEQCGDGNCEPRLAGAGPIDRICCLADCGATGQQCNASGQCQDPTLLAGAACGAPGQRPCGEGLECKDCLDGGRQCTPLDQCCGGCVPGFVCNAGTCGCPIGSNGRPQLACGLGQCVLDRENACCTASPQCPANLSKCDGSEGLCVACLTDTDCGPCSNCSTNKTCVPLGRGQAGRCGAGNLCNGQGACFTPRCTGIGQCGDCQTCSDFSCVAVGQGSPCSQNRICTFDQRCVQCIDETQCAGRPCNGGTCTPAECAPGARQCSANGVPQLCGQNSLFVNQAACTGGTQCQAGACVTTQQQDGVLCASNAQCLSNNCAGQRCCSPDCPNGCRPDGTCSPNGFTCALAVDCQSGNCVGRTCCAVPSCGECQTCGANGCTPLSGQDDVNSGCVSGPETRTSCVDGQCVRCGGNNEHVCPGVTADQRCPYVAPPLTILNDVCLPV
jgi:hypothetical protein